MLPEWLFLWYVVNGVICYVFLTIGDRLPATAEQRRARARLGRRAFLNTVLLLHIGLPFLIIGAILLAIKAR